MAIRNVIFECELTTLAAGREIPGLLALATERADDRGATQPDALRCLRLETLEELADARNYLVWWAQTILEGRNLAQPAGEYNPELLRNVLGAIGQVALLFEALEKLR